MPDQLNKLAPAKSSGLNRLVDMAVQNVNPNWFPTAGRVFAQTMQGERRPITEADYTPEELAVMRQLIAFKGGDEGSIQYPDYVRFSDAERKRTGRYTALSVMPSILSMGDPYGNVQTSLGRFRYYKDADGNLSIVDTYDFNPPPPNASEAALAEQTASGPYGMLRGYAGEKVPPGYGRQVRINLGR